MGLAELIIPPSLDAKQVLRLRRFGLAALTYFLGMALVELVSIFGLLPAAPALQAIAAALAINLVFYAVFRSGFNQRFADPSLTVPQIVLAIALLMFVIYHMDDGRSIALYGCFLIFLFGTFRLRAREFVLLTLYTLAAYGLVIVLLTQWRPQAIHNLWLDWVSLLVLAGVLPCFTLVGGQINALRRALRESEIRFRALTEMSSDFYWESDAEHRLTERGSADEAEKRGVGVPAGRADRQAALGSALPLARRGGLARTPGDARCAPAVPRFRALAPRRRRHRALHRDQRRSSVRCERQIHRLPRRRHRRHGAPPGGAGAARKRGKAAPVHRQRPGR